MTWLLPAKFALVMSFDNFTTSIKPELLRHAKLLWPPQFLMSKGCKMKTMPHT